MVEIEVVDESWSMTEKSVTALSGLEGSGAH